MQIVKNIWIGFVHGSQRNLQYNIKRVLIKRENRESKPKIENKWKCWKRNQRKYLNSDQIHLTTLFKATWGNADIQLYI